MDALHATDGQTLTELCGVVPEMTRYGVMNHLSVLESADLIATRKAGRTKLHYLNPVPIRLAYERWITKFTEPSVIALTQAKERLENQMEPTTDRPVHVHQIYIRTDPETIWDALVNGEITVQYYYRTRVESTWDAGSPVTYAYEDGTIAADGTLIAVDPPRRLEMLFHPRWDAEIAGEGPVRMVWAIEDAGPMSKISVEMWDIRTDGRIYRDFTEGIPLIVSGLKTLLETGSSLVTG